MGSMQNDLTLSIEDAGGGVSGAGDNSRQYKEADDYYANQPGDAISINAINRNCRTRLGVALTVVGLLAIAFATSVLNSSNDIPLRAKEKKEKYQPGDERQPEVFDPLYSNSDVETPNDTIPTTPLPTQPVPEPTFPRSPISNSELWNYIATNLHQEALLEESSIYYRAYSWLEQDLKLDTYDEKQIKQRYATACLYMATNQDDSWVKTDGWMTGENECDWFGISCDIEGRILELNLTANGLVGTVPQQIRFLSDSLLTLELHENEITNQGVELAWLSQLTNLLALNIRETKFSYDGIPAYLSHLTDIRVLEIASTAFAGAIDGSIFEPMKELIYLDMGGNLYNSTFPMEIARLPSLEALYLDNTNLYGNIGFLSEMKSPYEIWMDDNPNLGGTIPTEIGKHFEMASLSISNCAVIGTLPSELGNLGHMQQMWLFGNYITGSIPSEIGSLYKLRIFQTEDNYISGDMPNDICDLTEAGDSSGLIALGADCEPPGEVQCTCCTCCAAPCDVVNIPSDQRFLYDKAVRL